MIGVLSWDTIQDTAWIAEGMLHWSGVLSLWAGVLSAQQSTLLLALPTLTVESSEKDMEKTLRLISRRIILDIEGGKREERGAVDWKMMFIWQSPIMLSMSQHKTLFSGLVDLLCEEDIAIDY